MFFLPAGVKNNSSDPFNFDAKEKEKSPVAEVRASSSKTVAPFVATVFVNKSGFISKLVELKLSCSCSEIPRLMPNPIHNRSSFHCTAAASSPNAAKLRGEN